MSLDFSLVGEETEEVCECMGCGDRHLRKSREVLFDTNITHNLNTMFQNAGAYEVLWRGTGKKAKEILPNLEAALIRFEQDPKHFHQFDPPNGWGSYHVAVAWLREVIQACKANPEATVESCP